MRFLYRAFKRLAAGILLVAFCYGLAALVLGYLPANSGFRPTAGGPEIFVCTNGVHTDFVLPVKAEHIDWSKWFPDTDFAVPANVSPSALGYVAIGWGNMAFYLQTPTWADVKLGVALRSLVPLDPSVLHVSYRPRPIEEENCRGLTVSPAQYKALARYVEDALIQDPNHARIGGGHTVAGALKPWLLAGKGYAWNDAFYMAKGRYSAIDSCNVWVGRGLKAAELPTGIWTPFDFLVLHHLNARLKP